MPYLHFKAYQSYIKGAELKIEVCSEKTNKNIKKEIKKEKNRTTKKIRLVSLSVQIT